MTENYPDNSETVTKSYDIWGDFITNCLDVICMEVRTELCESNYKSI